MMKNNPCSAEMWSAGCKMFAGQGDDACPAKNPETFASLCNSGQMAKFCGEWASRFQSQGCGDTAMPGKCNCGGGSR